MDAIGSEARWITSAILLGLAAVAVHFARWRIWLLATALVVTPLPAFFFLRYTIRPPLEAPEDQTATGILLEGVACCLAPALGALTAYLVECAMNGAKQPAKPTLDYAEELGSQQ